MSRFSDQIRPAVNAGRFYPSDPSALRDTISSLLESAAGPASAATPSALIVPHAGYVFSGPTAAAAYLQLKNHHVDRVIILGPSHYRRLPGIAAAYSGTAFQTPFGPVRLDQEFLDLVFSRIPLSIIPVLEETQEHSIEVQLPFLQVVLSEFRLVPLLMTQTTFPEVLKLAQALVAAIRELSDGLTLLIASSDLYHGYDELECERQDWRTEQLITNCEAEQLLRDTSSGLCMACGASAIATVLEVSCQLKKRQATIITRTNSNQTKAASGGYVVGYLSAVFS